MIRKVTIKVLNIIREEEKKIIILKKKTVNIVLKQKNSEKDNK